MTELLTSDQMRALEAAEIDSGAVTGVQLMERAGQGVVDAMLRHWPELAEGGHKALVLSGPGNNGGDGFVIARLLSERGWHVHVFLYGDPSRLPPDAKTNHDRWAARHTVGAWDLGAIKSGGRPDIIVDAVFGIGLTRPLPVEVAAVLDRAMVTAWRNATQIKRVAVDCPSGLNLDNGHVPLEGEPGTDGSGPWPAPLNSADLTVTFHTPKPGHYLGMGPLLCGALRVADIGLMGDARERVSLMHRPDPERVRLVAPDFNGRRLSQWPMRLIGKGRAGGHKYQHGHCMVFAGGVGRGGAGRLAARSALRAGAGLVTVLCPPAALQENACHLDAVMLRALRDDAPLDDVADDRVTAFCLGPGMRVSEMTQERVLEVLARRAGHEEARHPAVVLDADALGSFADMPERLFSAAHARTILTPHEGEFARLFPDLARNARGTRSKIDVAREAAARAGCIVLLKGEDT
ncbi:MAG: NAD(P)H-hydrate epimerase, partial [Roseobacter sp.]